MKATRWRLRLATVLKGARSDGVMNQDPEKLVFALPKGRILKDVMPLMRAAGIEPEPEFDDGDLRKLRFSTNRGHVEIIRVRSFDVATFVAHGAAQLGISGPRS